MMLRSVKKEVVSLLQWLRLKKNIIHNIQAKKVEIIWILELEDEMITFRTNLHASDLKRFKKHVKSNT